MRGGRWCDEGDEDRDIGVAGDEELAKVWSASFCGGQGGGVDGDGAEPAAGAVWCFIAGVGPRFFIEGVALGEGDDLVGEADIEFAGAAEFAGVEGGEEALAGEIVGGVSLDGLASGPVELFGVIGPAEHGGEGLSAAVNSGRRELGHPLDGERGGGAGGRWLLEVGEVLAFDVVDGLDQGTGEEGVCEEAAPGGDALREGATLGGEGEVGGVKGADPA